MEWGLRSSLVDVDGTDWANLPSNVPDYMMIYRNVARAINPSFDGDPLRVDYNNDGSISLGLDTSEKPEAWIVQVQKTYGEKRINKNYNSTNTLI